MAAITSHLELKKHLGRFLPKEKGLHKDHVVAVSQSYTIDKKGIGKKLKIFVLALFGQMIYRLVQESR